MTFDSCRAKILDFVTSDSRLDYEFAIDVENQFLIYIISKKTGIWVGFRIDESTYPSQGVTLFGLGLELQEEFNEENFNTLFNTLKMCIKDGKRMRACNENKEWMFGTMWTDDKYYTPQDVFDLFGECYKDGFARNGMEPTKYISFTDFYGDNEILLKIDGDTFVVEPCNK